MEPIFKLAINLGGSLSDYTVWLLERSIKTMGIRVKAQNANAGHIANYLEKHDDKKSILSRIKNHKDHELAKKQM